ncbi:protein of unknown function [Candidatus Methylomirabilis oxygeniifera]|uniref:Uncharacterized protein n=1 Tax=Methylomirabilis oxygeniifera TaxID=671143 RepID=D5MHB4_METO1|nr:protein of unknown function [Candidatus Methylomirabilis oxyfera]
MCAVCVRVDVAGPGMNGAECPEIRRASVGKAHENRSAKAESLALTEDSGMAGYDPHVHIGTILHSDQIRHKRRSRPRLLDVNGAKG